MSTTNPSWHNDPNTSPADRNFDDLAAHFAHKVYGGLKGQIRLAVLERDLGLVLDQLQSSPTKPLRVLDIGAGLGQMSLWLAKAGHDCTITDISPNMLDYAKAQAAKDNLNCTFITAPYQDLTSLLVGQHFDLILCHALLEWVESPNEVLALCDALLTDGGVLSLCFYNPASPVYRNLIMGNFNHLTHPKPANKGSLTPNHPVPYETVKTWLDDYRILHESGIRTFYDYTVHKRGGLAHHDEIIKMELLYSTLLPYRLMGRYLHVVSQKPNKNN